jgi:5-formyltetrahydrofolate cyclo-ligase
MTMRDCIKQWRKAQRTELLARRVAVAAKRRSAWTGAITASLPEGFPILQSLVARCYWPFQGEFDPLVFDVLHPRDRTPG